jgi:hypothetical protein
LLVLDWENEVLGRGERREASQWVVWEEGEGVMGRVCSREQPRVANVQSRAREGGTEE